MIQSPGASGTRSGDGVLALAVGGVQLEGGAGPRLGYRRAGEGYLEARQVPGEVVSIGDGVTLRFRLPDVSVEFILLEPAAIPGSYVLARLVFGGRDVPDLRRRVVHARERIGAAAPAGVRFESDSGRPALELDLRGLACDGGQHGVELVLLREADSAAATSALAKLREEVLHGREANEAAGTRLSRSLSAVADRIEDVALAVEDTPAMVVEQRKQSGRIGTLERQLDTLAADVGLMAREQSLAALAASLQHLSDGQDAMQATAQAQLALNGAASAAGVSAAEAAVRQLDGLQHALARLESAVGELRTQGVETRSQLERVTHAVENVFWRRWLRRLRGGGR